MKEPGLQSTRHVLWKGLKPLVTLTHELFLLHQGPHFPAQSQILAQWKDHYNTECQTKSYFWLCYRRAKISWTSLCPRLHLSPYPRQKGRWSGHSARPPPALGYQLQYRLCFLALRSNMWFPQVEWCKSCERKHTEDKRAVFLYTRVYSFMIHV